MTSISASVKRNYRDIRNYFMKKRSLLSAGKKWQGGIWQAFVEYANSGDGRHLMEAFALCAPVFEIDTMDDLSIAVSKLSHFGLTTFESMKQAFSLEAQKSLADFRRVLQCLTNAEDVQHQWLVPYLSSHSDGLSYVLPPRCDGRKFIWIKLDRCPSAMHPLYRYILDRILQVQRGELSAREAFPIAICEREECGQFMLLRRPLRKRFCSDRCRALVSQRSRSRDDWNKYMRDYRKTVREGKARPKKKTNVKRRGKP